MAQQSPTLQYLFNAIDYYVSGLVIDYRVSDSQLSGCGFESRCGPFASNLEQVANLRCAQVNSASAEREMSSRSYGVKT